MRRYRTLVVCATGVSLLSPIGQLASQQVGESLPETTLSLTKAEPLSVTLPSPVLEGPVGCLTDGSLVVHTILDMNPARPADPTVMIVSIVGRDGSVQTFDLQKVSDLKNVSDRYVYDAGLRDVVFLITGEPKDREADPGADQPLYAARFDRHGAYQGSVLLPGQFETRRLAAFPSGDLLLMGMDKNRPGVQLARFSPIGGSTSYYSPETPLVEKNSSLPLQPNDDKLSAEIKARLSLQAAIDFSQMVHFRESILLLQMNAGSVLYEVHSNGSIRTIQLPKEEGFAADSVIKSDESLYVRYRRAGTNIGRGADAYILQIDPGSGTKIRKLRSENSTIWDVSCVHNGDFTIVRMKDEHTFEFLTARTQ